jgi:hypothetical protein
MAAPNSILKIKRAGTRIIKVNRNWIKLKKTVDRGSISRGKKTFLIKFELSITEPAPMERDELKKVQGKNPHKKKTAKFSTLILIIYLKATV